MFGRRNFDAYRGRNNAASNMWGTSSKRGHYFSCSVGGITRGMLKETTLGGFVGNIPFVEAPNFEFSKTF